MTILKQVLTSFILLSCISLIGQKVQNEDFQKLLEKELVHDVPEIDVSTLLLMENYVLFDARSIEEYNVSHIQGAEHVDFVHFDLQKMKDVSKKQAIVVYCSVGSRSEKVTRLLIQAGYGQTFNLYGGIFEWCNAGQPMYSNQNQITKKIHGVTPYWSEWVTNCEVVFE